jgi:transposase
VLILDNCHIHHAEEIRQLVEDDAHVFRCFFAFHLQILTSFPECKLIFLPPYFPNYNPIKQAFSSIKLFLQRNWQDQSLGVMDNACHAITPAKALGYFKSSGYIV